MIQVQCSDYKIFEFWDGLNGWDELVVLLNIK